AAGPADQYRAAHRGQVSAGDGNSAVGKSQTDRMTDPRAGNEKTQNEKRKKLDEENRQARKARPGDNPKGAARGAARRRPGDSSDGDLSSRRANRCDPAVRGTKIRARRQVDQAHLSGSPDSHG